jgi:hypothetical protein
MRWGRTCGSNFLFESKFVNRFVHITYSPSHRQAGTPMINIQSTIRTAPDLCKNVGSNRNSYTISRRSYMWIYTYILHNIQTLVGQKKQTAGATMNAACQGNLPTRARGHECHRFACTGIDGFDEKRLKWGDCLEDLDIDKRIILKFILNAYDDRL